MLVCLHALLMCLWAWCAQSACLRRLADLKKNTPMGLWSRYLVYSVNVCCFQLVLGHWEPHNLFRGKCHFCCVSWFKLSNVDLKLNPICLKKNEFQTCQTTLDFCVLGSRDSIWGKMFAMTVESCHAYIQIVMLTQSQQFRKT